MVNHMAEKSTTDTYTYRYEHRKIFRKHRQKSSHSTCMQGGYRGIPSHSLKTLGSKKHQRIKQCHCPAGYWRYFIYFFLVQNDKLNFFENNRLSLIRCCFIGPPLFEVWDVTTGMDGIIIHYGLKKRPPYVNEIKWMKDEVPISNRNNKCEGGGLNESCFTITSPTIEDRGNYSCIAKNAVDCAKKNVQLGTANLY